MGVTQHSFIQANASHGSPTQAQDLMHTRAHTHTVVQGAWWSAVSQGGHAGNFTLFFTLKMSPLSSPLRRKEKG